MKTLRLATALFVIALLLTNCKKEDATPAVIEQTVNGEVSGTWTKGSIITVKTDIIVPVGKTLTIEEGVSVIMDTTAKPEFIVNGNLYLTGSARNPITITVPETARLSANKFAGLWGGIIAGKTCTEVLIDNALIEYGGAITTEASTSVKLGLYKAAAGQSDPALWFSNTAGKVVVRNTTVRNWREDCIYIEGGNVLLHNNAFYTIGGNSGDAIDIKGGTLADVAFNFFYSNNTNGLRVSNAGGRSPQTLVVAYNNTMVNNGWRKPTIKGGSVWVEQSVRAEFYNNLLANCRFGIKRDVKNPEDPKSKISNTYYYAYSQTGADQFQPSADILAGTNDILSKNAGDNDPKFVNYPLNTNLLNADYNAAWDFGLQPNSPALGKGITTFTRNFAAGIVLNGQTYKSPEPATFAGAFDAR